MSTPDATADAIRALCTAIQHIDPDTVDRDRALADVAYAIISHVERLEAQLASSEASRERWKGLAQAQGRSPLIPAVQGNG